MFMAQSACSWSALLCRPKCPVGLHEGTGSKVVGKERDPERLILWISPWQKRGWAEQRTKEVLSEMTAQQVSAKISRFLVFLDRKISEGRAQQTSEVPPCSFLLPSNCKGWHLSLFSAGLTRSNMASANPVSAEKRVWTVVKRRTSLIAVGEKRSTTCENGRLWSANATRGLPLHVITDSRNAAIISSRLIIKNHRYEQQKQFLSPSWKHKTRYAAKNKEDASENQSFNSQKTTFST